MDTEVDLTTVDRAVLIAIIAELQAVIERLQPQDCRTGAASCETGRLRSECPASRRNRPGSPQRSRGLPRKQRRHRLHGPPSAVTPTHRVEHVMENCPDCGAHRSGGWTQRTREVIELPVVPVQVTEHVYIARTCPAYRRHGLPAGDRSRRILDRSRLPGLKENQRLYEDVEGPASAPRLRHPEQSGRIERRACWTISDPLAVPVVGWTPCISCASAWGPS